MTEIKITEPVLLIRTSRLFKEGMTAVELYEITQGVWILGTDREKATYAFCIANMIVQEIYAIQYWQETVRKPIQLRHSKKLILKTVDGMVGGSLLVKLRQPLYGINTLENQLHTITKKVMPVLLCI